MLLLQTYGTEEPSWYVENINRVPGVPVNGKQKYNVFAENIN